MSEICTTMNTKNLAEMALDMISDLEQSLETHMVRHMLVHIHSDSDSDHETLPTTIDSDDESWEQLSDLDMEINSYQTSRPTCTPQLFGHRTKETEEGKQPLKRAKFYNVYTGDGAGTYRDWSEAGARTNKVSGALHQSFQSWEEALEAWKQYCLSHHDHPSDMQDGTVYIPVQSTPQPRSVSPPRHSVRAQSIAPQHVPAPSTPTQLAGTSTRRVAESPQELFSSSQSRHGSPSKKRVATALSLHLASQFLLLDHLSGLDQKRIVVFNREEVDEIMREAARRGLRTQQREVDSIVEASEWFSQLDLSTESSSVSDDLT
ncbi:hypothetical protein D9758_018236 [Tetrapyrgos nigripes]|uniref:Ribonuclease H1 N-terminal domain-containing protein n=1 Tax=Tetrapyrgos nigripes TaxID=182062 RepID=A0A8H5BLU3_9AGAR|nr:hypothetical protein D9758_018236 [Tetrapyrgos nigripes]